MKRLIFITLIITILSSFPTISKAQIETIDTSKTPMLPIGHFKAILADTYTDTLTTHIWVFGNPDCHRCTDLHKLLVDNNISYVEYDMRDPRYFNISHDLVVKVAKTESLSYSFPIVVVNTKIYYSIPDIQVFFEELKKNIRK